MNTEPFYEEKERKAVGVLFDGNCGLTYGAMKMSPAKTVAYLAISPLKEKKKPGDQITPDEILFDDDHEKIELVFTNTKSIDLVISTLTALKEYYNKEMD